MCRLLGDASGLVRIFDQDFLQLGHRELIGVQHELVVRVVFVVVIHIRPQWRRIFAAHRLEKSPIFIELELRFEVDLLRRPLLRFGLGRNRLGARGQTDRPEYERNNKPLRDLNSEHRLDLCRRSHRNHLG